MSSDYQAMAEEAILNHFRNPEHEPFHSDDLWHVIPDAHRNVIGLAIMALVNKKVIVGTGVYRKSAIPSRKRSPSQEYRLTERGRDLIAGVGVSGAGSQSAPDSKVQADTHPGEQSAPIGAPSSAEGGRATNPSASGTSGLSGESPGATSHVPGGSARLFDLDAARGRPRSALTDPEAA